MVVGAQLHEAVCALDLTHAPAWGWCAVLQKACCIRSHGTNLQTKSIPAGPPGGASGGVPEPQSGVLLFSDFLNAKLLSIILQGHSSVRLEWYSRRFAAHAGAKAPLSGRQGLNAAGWVILI